MSLARYVELVNEQRANFPGYDKYHYSNPIINFTKTAADVVADLLTFPSAYYINTIETINPLYSDVEDFIYLEYVDTSFVTAGTLSDWRYFYIPVSLRASVETQKPLPYYNHYNAGMALVERVYPTKPFMYSLDRPSLYTFAEPLKTHRHPFGDHYLFTGNFYLKPNINKYVYEYIDFKQISEYGRVILYSDIAPVGFYPLANRLNRVSFQDTPPANVQLPPSQLSWVGSLPDLRFTGRITNETFAPNHPWFEYRLYVDDLPIERYILPDPPTTLSLDYVSTFLGEDMGINIPIHSNNQRIKYKQVSANQNLVIYP